MNTALLNRTVTASQPAAQYFTPYYPELAAFLENTDQALLIQQIHYWLQNEKVGYQLKDGRRWIYNGYKDWIEQLFPWKSVSAISRIVTDLEEKGWLITKRFYQCKQEIGFVERPPSAFHEDNQRKWYRLDYEQIYSDTGFDLLFKPSREKEAPKRPRRANSQKCKLQLANLQYAISNSANCSIYKDHQEITKSLSNDQREKIVANVTKLEELTTNVPTADFCKDLSQTVNNLEEVDLGLAETLVKANVPPPRPKKAKLTKREKFEWEIRVNKPYQDFVHWRANTHYVPQGERWAAGAESNAFSEIVNKSNEAPEKAEALWQQFLEYANHSAESARVRIENGMEASLPSCFDEKLQLDAVEVGKKLEGVKEAIKTEALPAVEKISVEAPGDSPAGEQNAADEQLTKLAEQVKRQCTTWRNIKHPKIRQSIQLWAERTPGVVMTEEGPALSAEVMNVEDSSSAP